MIKLQRGEKPVYLTNEKQKELTEAFKNDNKSKFGSTKKSESRY